MSRRRVWIAVALVTAGLVGFAADAGRLLVVDAPEPSDVILVLAGETDRRPARALQLLDQGYGRRVVIDVPATARIYEFPQLQLAERYIRDLPQSAAVRVCPIEGLSTREESHDAEKCLAAEEGGRILIVTSEFHTRRSLSIFRHDVRGKHFSVAVARDEKQFGTRWWTHRQWPKPVWRNGSGYCGGEWWRGGVEQNRRPPRGMGDRKDEFSTEKDSACPKNIDWQQSRGIRFGASHQTVNNGV